MTNPDPAQPPQDNSGHGSEAQSAGPPPAAGPASPYAAGPQANPGDVQAVPGYGAAVPGPYATGSGYPQQPYGPQPIGPQGFPQQGYGPQPGYPQQPFGGPPPRQRNLALWLSLAGGGAIVLIVVVVIAGYLILHESDEDKINDSAAAYVAAVNRLDYRTQENLTCESRRSSVTSKRQAWERKSSARQEEERRKRKTTAELISVSDVNVYGDTATAKVTLRITTSGSDPSSETDTDTVDLKKEGDVWKLCEK